MSMSEQHHQDTGVIRKYLFRDTYIQVQFVTLSVLVRRMQASEFIQLDSM